MKPHTLKQGPFEYMACSTHSGPEIPNILFIHGATLSKGLWEAQLQGLKDMANTISLDLPGHGGSEGPGRNSIKSYADDVFRFIESAGIDPANTVLCGMSMGGAIAQQLLIDNPDRFKAAVLINTGSRLKVLPAVFESVRENYSAFIQSMPAFSLSPQTDRSLFEQKIISLTHGCTAETAMGDFDACNSFDVMDMITAIRCPVLVCTAENDISTPVKYGLWLKDNIPASEYFLVKEAGHLSMIEKPDDINNAIRSFISSFQATDKN